MKNGNTSPFSFFISQDYPSSDDILFLIKYGALAGCDRIYRFMKRHS